MAYSALDIRTATKTVYGEARGEPMHGKAAVAWVIRNRADNPGWWGGPSLHSVCLKPWQFSCWNENDPNYSKLKALSDTDLLGASVVAQECLAAVLNVMCGLWVDPTHGADHYVVTSWLTDPKLCPKWAKGHDPVAVIGSQSFYRIGL